MSTLKKDHILGAGSAALAGGAVGGALGGMIAGPPGLAIGAAAGGALGAIVGNRASEAADSSHDLGHFQQIFKTMPYYLEGHDWPDYAPAYRYGLDSYKTHGRAPMASMETQLQGGWEAAAHFGSRLTWQQARPAIAHAWESLYEAEHAQQTTAGTPD